MWYAFKYFVKDISFKEFIRIYKYRVYKATNIMLAGDDSPRSCCTHLLDALAYQPDGIKRF